MLRIYAVNSTAEPEKLNFQSDDFTAPVAGGEALVLQDRERALDSEAMNSSNDPERITTSSQALNAKGRSFSFSFTPYSVTLLELKLELGP